MGICSNFLLTWGGVNPICSTRRIVLGYGEEIKGYRLGFGELKPFKVMVSVCLLVQYSHGTNLLSNAPNLFKLIENPRT